MTTGRGSNGRRVVAFLVVLLAAGVATADFRFGVPRNLGPVVNSIGSDGSPEISADGLTLYFDSRRADGIGDWDIWMTTRAPGGDWGEPEPLPWPVNSVYADAGASLSADGLSLYFASNRFGGYGDFDLWVTRRKTTDDPWGPAENLGPTINTDLYENHPCISADGLSLYFDSSQPWGIDYDLWVSTRKTTKSPWGVPVNLGPLVNSGGIELSPNIHAGNRVLFWDSRTVDRDIWMATRASANDPWTLRLNVGPAVNTPNFDTDPAISADGSMLYFASDRSGGAGGQDLWEVPVLAVVDLNGDGVVNLRDLSVLALRWQADDRSADVGPTPFGDGIVDAWDVAVLAESWLADYRFAAHWKLDESTGSLAHDSAGEHDGILQGNPVWQPEGGRLGGAIQLDGLDDCIIMGAVVDPAAGPLSVFAWVKGGAPGQVILSQVNAANWLRAGTASGGLMTELRYRGRFGRDLESSVVITDGAWHRVGLVWDGSNRSLYVDDVEAAADTQPALTGSTEGLHIGADNALTPGAFWSGLIDDVRIYNRVVKP